MLFADWLLTTTTFVPWDILEAVQITHPMHNQFETGGAMETKVKMAVSFLVVAAVACAAVCTFVFLCKYSNNSFGG